MTVLEQVKTYEELEEKLSGYYGTECYHRPNPFVKPFLTTDGVIAFAELTGGYWFLDEIALHLREIWNDRDNMFAVIRLTSNERKNKTNNADIKVYVDYDSSMSEEENDKEYLLYKKHIGYTDMVTGTHKFYIARDDVDSLTSVMMLPQEY